MDSRESLGNPPPQNQQQQHTQPPLPGMMMAPPNSYNPHIPNNTNNNNNTNSSTMINPNSTNSTMMQQNPRSNFPFNSDSLNSQYGGGGGGDGSSPVSGFRAGGFSIEPARKKRGRPRKYSPNPLPDGNIALGLAPSPISITPVGGGGGQVVELSNNDGTPMSGSEPSTKKHRGRPPGSGKKQLDALGAPGVGFTPHVITVKAGEDISKKILSFTQQGPRTVCILSANGAICNVTLRQPAMSGGTVTYEGRFEIISLSGSFQPSESNGSCRSGGLSVSLAGSDGRVLGGGVSGMLLAATPVQVVVGSFIAEGKKSKSGPTSAPPPNLLNFGGPVPGVSPPSEGASSESSDESGSSPLHRLQGPYNNASQPIQNLPMYSNMGWPNSTMNMLPN